MHLDHPRPRPGRRSGALLALAAASLVAPASAAAHGRPPATPTLGAPIADGLAGPLQLAVGRGRTLYVAQSFAGLLTRLAPAPRADVASDSEVAGVDVGRHGTVWFTTSTVPGPDAPPTSTALERLRGGVRTRIADLLAYEQAQNPDAGVTYGARGIDAACAAQWPVEAAGPPTYTGIVESHPYAVAVSGRHRYVADAAANAILDVHDDGTVRTVAVLPPQPATISADAAAEVGLPACAVGLTYDFEPVPTDVEVGRDGALYVTTLPGGPESASLGARGSVYRVNPRSGHARRLATGFLGAANLALGRHGAIYVSELFANRISTVHRGGPRPLLDLPSPAALEYSRGRLVVGYDVFASGKVATVDLGRRARHHGHGAPARRSASAVAALRQHGLGGWPQAAR